MKDYSAYIKTSDKDSVVWKQKLYEKTDALIIVLDKAKMTGAPNAKTKEIQEQYNAVLVDYTSGILMIESGYKNDDMSMLSKAAQKLQDGNVSMKKIDPLAYKF